MLFLYSNLKLAQKTRRWNSLPQEKNSLTATTDNTGCMQGKVILWNEKISLWNKNCIFQVHQSKLHVRCYYLKFQCQYSSFICIHCPKLHYLFCITAAGETIRVLVYADNSLSCDVKLKYSLKQQQTFIAGTRTNNAYRNIVKEVKDRIPSGGKTEVVIDLKLPPDIIVTIGNCRIIKVQYELKVSLMSLWT